MKSMLALADQVRETSYSIHTYLRHGHVERVYENALVHRLRKLGHTVEQQVRMAVFGEDGTILGDYVADLRVDGQLLVEVKATKMLIPEHTAQILGYMRATEMHHGMLINFGAPRLQVRKYILQNRLNICFAPGTHHPLL